MTIPPISTLPHRSDIFENSSESRPPELQRQIDSLKRLYSFIAETDKKLIELKQKVERQKQFISKAESTYNHVKEQERQIALKLATLRQERYKNTAGPYKKIVSNWIIERDISTLQAEKAILCKQRDRYYLALPDYYKVYNELANAYNKTVKLSKSLTTSNSIPLCSYAFIKVSDLEAMKDSLTEEERELRKKIQSWCLASFLPVYESSDSDEDSNLINSIAHTSLAETLPVYESSDSQDTQHHRLLRTPLCPSVKPNPQAGKHISFSDEVTIWGPPSRPSSRLK